MPAHTPAPNPPDPSIPDRILSWPEVKRMVPLSRVTIWKLRQRDAFPKPIRLSESRIGWRLSDLIAWMNTRSAA